MWREAGDLPGLRAGLRLLPSACQPTRYDTADVHAFNAVRKQPGPANQTENH